jgi:hypothetical protein
MASGLELDDIVADPGVSGSATMLERSGGWWFIDLGAGDAVIEAKLDACSGRRPMPCTPSRSDTPGA